MLLVAITAWVSFRTVSAPSTVPGDEAWRQATAFVRSQYQAGDLIVFAPAWIDPVGRMHLGDLIAIDDAARASAARYGTIWQLSIRDAEHPDTVAAQLQDSRDFSGVVVGKYTQVAKVVLAETNRLLATVSKTGSAARGPTLELAEVGFAPHRCIQVVPAAGQPVRLTFPAMVLGSRLKTYVGLADVFTRRDVREPGTLQIEIGGQIVADRTFGVDDGWVDLSVATTAGAADVTFIASAGAVNRLICFAAESWQ
jgi:hypothetical protein